MTMSEEYYGTFHERGMLGFKFSNGGFSMFQHQFLQAETHRTSTNTDITTLVFLNAGNRCSTTRIMDINTFAILSH